MEQSICHISFQRVCKLDCDKQIVCGEVYAPNVIDSHGEMMVPEDVEKLAHRFLKMANLGATIDVKHGQVPVNAYPVESFLASDQMPEYSPGAWVLAVKIEDAALWAEVRKGDINGFSFQALVYKVEAQAEVTIYPETIGQTEENEAHKHFFFAELDSSGKVRAGRTSVTNGHSHDIMAGTATNEAEGHTHRFFL